MIQVRPEEASGVRWKLRQRLGACELKRIEVKGHDLPNRVQIDDVVGMPEVIADLPDLIPRGTGGHALGRIAEPHGSLTDATQAAFHGGDDKLVRLERPFVETGCETPDGSYVVEDLLKAPARAFRCHSLAVPPG